MKKAFIALIAMLLCLSIALAETVLVAPDECPGVEMELIAGGIAETVYIVLPEGFTLQSESSSEKYDGHSYTFANLEKGITFYATCYVDNKMDQDILLRKVKDPTNHFILFEDVLIGDYHYMVYSSSLQSHMWIFLMLTDDGYSYRFDYHMPAGRGQDTIPDDAVAILSTLRLLEESIVE